MALFISNQAANLFGVKTLTSKKGKEFGVADVVFYSKKKDENGEYTVEDTPLTVRGISFSKSVLEYISSLETDRAFVKVSGKLTTEKNDKDVYFNRLLITKMEDFSVTITEEDDIEEDLEDGDVPF